MRVAVLSDIHGNLPALDVGPRRCRRGRCRRHRAQRRHRHRTNADTLDRLAALGDRAIWVHGNCDRELLEAYDGKVNPDLPNVARLPTEYAATRLSARHRDLLADLPLSVTLEPFGLGPVRFCHATTDTEMVLVDSPVERYREAFANCAEPTVVLGHTHMPFDRLADRRQFVNPGSEGMPYGRSGALWALLGPDVSLRRAEYDARSAAQTFRAMAPDYPGLEEFIAENVLAVPSDAEALAVFSGRAA
jgi:predicted phosphodiesterase